MDMEGWKVKTLKPDGRLAKGDKLADGWVSRRVVEVEIAVVVVVSSYVWLVLFVAG
jgi:hypothetical protein